MAMRDFLESEVAIAVAATAALSSARVRRVLRRGAIYGLAGAMMAGDAIAAAARDAQRGAQQAAAPAATGDEGATERAEASPEGGNTTPGDLLRRGAAAGLAKALIAGDAIASTARNVGRDVQQAAASVAQDAREQAQAGMQATGVPASQGTADTGRESSTPSSEATPDE